MGRVISDFDLAKRLFPKARQLVQDAGLTASRTTQVRGWATADSADGAVTVVLDTTATGTDAEITVPTTGGITEGSEVQVTLVDGAPVGCSQVGSIDVAQGLARAAQAVADAINQFFWTDSSGAHVTQVPQDEWDDPDSASYHSGPNALWNALGMLFRNGLNNLLALTGGTTPGVSIYDGAGNADSNIIASFVGNLIELGRNSTAAVIKLCGGKGVISYRIDSDTLEKIFSIVADEQFDVSSRHEYGSTSESVAGVNLSSYETSTGDVVSRALLTAIEDASSNDRIHRASVSTDSGSSSNGSGYSGGSSVTMYGANILVTDPIYNPYGSDFPMRTLIEALKMVKTAGDTITATGLRIGGYITGNKTECKLTIHTPYRFYGVTSCIISGTYTVRQGGIYLFGSTATAPCDFAGHYAIDSINADLGTINVTISTGVAQSAATNNDPANIVLNTCTITLS